MSILLEKAAHVRLGIATPTKELSDSTQQNNQSPSELSRYLLNAYDFPELFYVVYHHTTLHAEHTHLETQEPGESRYRKDTSFPDPFSVLNRLVQATEKAELFTGVLVTPQMQTTYVAQQVAAITNASHGRFRLGVGVGWSSHEYEALGMGHRFRIRGEVLNKQIPLLRKLLLGETITDSLDHEALNQMSINPHSNYPVPIWIGGQSNAALNRAALQGDGWMPMGNVGPYNEQITYLRQQLEKNGRTKNTFPTMGRIPLAKISKTDWVDSFLAWAKAGVSHIALSTTNRERMTPEKHEYKYHQRMVADFFNAVEWVRLPKTGFTRLFADQEVAWHAPESKHWDSEALSACQLNTHIHLKHVAMYLEQFQFQPFILEESLEIKIPRLSDQPLIFVSGMKHPTEKSVWIFTEKVTPSHYFLVYNSSFNLGMPKKS